MIASTLPDDNSIRAFETSASATHWKKVGIRHHHGINLPLFSLHSRASGGIGEYLDLIPLIRWLPTVGLDVLQLLPLNDTGEDSSPYNALSAFALNPLHISFCALPELAVRRELQDCLAQLQKLSHTPRVDYNTIRPLRNAFLFRYFELAYPHVQRHPDYQNFLKNNNWLNSYALFKTLKEQQSGRCWEEWPEEWRNPSPQTREELLQRFHSRIQYHCFLQYLCWQQLSTVKREADSHGVLLKGDIPILISRDSADYWEHRELFHPELSAGAPPDMYAQEGQNWGFPVYDWEAMEHKNFSWWRTRLKVAEQFYHLYRLDHVVGFFRIWTIPPGSLAKDGAFLPEDEASWVPLGRKILLMMLESSSMLPIGEDLGVIPPAVRDVLRSLKICGTKVMRWERLWNEDQRFIPPQDYIQESLTTVSTHDSEPLRLWWETCPNESRAYAQTKGWSYDSTLSRERLQMILWDSHHTSSLFHINLLQEYLALFPDLRWSAPNDDRINTPGTIGPWNWSFRFQASVEDICNDSALGSLFSQLVR